MFPSCLCLTQHITVQYYNIITMSLHCVTAFYLLMPTQAYKSIINLYKCVIQIDRKTHQSQNAGCLRHTEHTETNGHGLGQCGDGSEQKKEMCTPNIKLPLIRAPVLYASCDKWNPIMASVKRKIGNRTVMILPLEPISN